MTGPAVFRCGHPRDSDNARKSGKSVRCLACKRAADLRYLARNLDRERTRKREYARKRRAAELELLQGVR